ncbi:MAG: type I polyketide synthase, partial [Microcystaceae cyanobacterium]
WQINPANPEDFQRLFQEDLSKVAPQLTGIIHLWSLEATVSDALTSSTLDQAQCFGCQSVLYLIQTLSQQSLSPQLWLVTRGTQAVEAQIDSLAVASASLWGLGKVIALEHPESWGGMIDLAANQEADEASLLLSEITHSDGEDHIAFRQGQRYVCRLTKVKKESSNSQLPITNSQLPITINKV